jgi:hypothetical protein
MNYVTFACKLTSVYVIHFFPMRRLYMSSNNMQTGKKNLENGTKQIKNARYGCVFLGGWGDSN